MFKNISSKNLLFIFLILLILAAIFVYYDSTTEVRTFKKDIVNIDTAKVTSLSIYSKATNHKEVKLFKQGNYWMVQLENNKSVPAEASKIKNLINSLAQIKTSSVAGQDESKWAEFQVDTSGTRVKVFEGNDNTLDMVIGKFSYQQQTRSMSSYVRVKGDNNIYEVAQFMGFSFNQKPDAFRNNYIVNDDMKNWKSVSYTYPADSSFTLIKDTLGHWSINNIQTDSVKTANFLRTLSHLMGNEFVDNPDQSLLGKATYSVSILSSANEGEPKTIDVSAFGNQFLLNSSQNPESYFNGNANSLKDKIFVGKSHFLKK
jgi:Domain of unknown function (DUF4340)